MRRARAARSCLGLTAEVDGVKSDYTITFSSWKINAAGGRAYASAKAPGGRRREVRRCDRGIDRCKAEGAPREEWQEMLECGRVHLVGFMRYAELAGIIARWLEERGR